MKLLAGITLSVSVLVGGNSITRPEAFLKQGNVIQFEANSKMQGGQASRTAIALEIVAVAQAGSKTTAKGELTYYSSNGLENMVSIVRFMCDSSAFCANTTNWFYIPKERMKGTAEDYSGDTLVYPFSISVGDSLPDGHAKRILRSNSCVTTENINLHERYVADTDSLKLSFGEISAYRIEGIMSSESVSDFVDGSDKNTKGSYVLVEWFSPAYGLVKSEYRYPTGHSTTEMTNPSVKK